VLLLQWRQSVYDTPDPRLLQKRCRGSFGTLDCERDFPHSACAWRSSTIGFFGAPRSHPRGRPAFGVPNGKLLGERGIEANPKKITAITWMGPIRNVKGV
jgi:hypothetical protein